MAHYVVPTDRFFDRLMSQTNSDASSSTNYLNITHLAVGWDADFWDPSRNLPKMPNPFVIKPSGNDYEVATVFIRCDLTTLATPEEDILKTFIAHNPDGYKTNEEIKIGYNYPITLIGGSSNSYQWANNRLEITLIAPCTVNAFEWYNLESAEYRVMYFASVPLITIENTTEADLDLQLHWVFPGGYESS